MTNIFQEQLRWWLREENVMTGISIKPFSPSVQLFTDASNMGWGAYMGDTMLSGVWSLQERQFHINCLELLAVIRAVELSVKELVGKEILLGSDNSTVVAYINRQGGTHSPQLCRLTDELLLMLHVHDSVMRARHIPGALNVLADSLSRKHQVQATEWSLHPLIVRQIVSVWGVPEVDLFATRLNNKFPMFVSPIPDHRAVAVDALSLDWNKLTAYTYPPTALIPMVLKKIRNSVCRIVLVVPAWPARAWFPDLLELLEQLPWQLPQCTRG
jgi:hypothetical protein